jgi:hypothetical protein
MQDKNTGVQWDSASAIQRLQYGREGLYDILTKIGVPVKLVRLIKIFINEAYSEVRIDKFSSGSFQIQNGLKKKML